MKKLIVLSLCLSLIGCEGASLSMEECRKTGCLVLIPQGTAPTQIKNVVLDKNNLAQSFDIK